MYSPLFLHFLSCRTTMCRNYKIAKNTERLFIFAAPFLHIISCLAKAL
ncbi:hypothetical protein EDWATA_03848 [Edwardsiella tarda ATCC 23685]|uniref:Uncharacterized protein n=1 Tax=Edwardsiella tarda ATCC 23685 TaxID=500638 RepID=D4FAM7_EDWTA|nr:hypothetical protein EDWATA_03848 [Edwardsiella tarda ATCC 23685]